MRLAMASNSSAVMPGVGGEQLPRRRLLAQARAIVFRSCSRKALKGWRSFIDGSASASSLQPGQREEHLHLHRLLAPQRAVVVEGGDALGGRHEVGAALLRHARDEVEDRRLAAPSFHDGSSGRQLGPAAASLIFATASSIVKLPASGPAGSP